MILLEKVEALPQIAPKPQQLRLVRMTLRERLESVFRQPRGKNLNGNVPLARRMSLHRQPVDLFNPLVGNGNAADGHAIPVQENISAGIRVRAEDSVRAIWIADVQAQEEIALRVKPIKFVEAFRNLHVAEFPFRSKHAGSRANHVD